MRHRGEVQTQTHAGYKSKFATSDLTFGIEQKKCDGVMKANDRRGNDRKKKFYTYNMCDAGKKVAEEGKDEDKKEEV